jgi:23S rRNA pseudouridine2604 synthase
VVQENKYVFRITLTQGMNRQIRRMCDALDYKVKKLVRVRIMNVQLGKLPLGHWRFLTADEIAILNTMVAESSKTESASRKPKKAAVLPKKEQETEDSLEDYAKAYEQSRTAPKKQKGFKDFRKAGKRR